MGGGARRRRRSTLKNESGQSSGTAASARVRKVLVCAQVMVSAVLLIPTGLFLKSLVNLMHVDLGMKTENVIGFSVSPALNGYKPEQTRALFERIESEMAAIPGREERGGGAGAADRGQQLGQRRHDRGRQGHAGQQQLTVQRSRPGILRQDGNSADRRAASSRKAIPWPGPKVAVVNETFVKRFLEGRNPLGVRFSGGGPGSEITIVGVVKDSHYSSVKRRGAALVLQALATGQGDQLAGVLRALRAAGEADGARRSGA